MDYKRLKKILLIISSIGIILVISLIVYNAVMYPSVGENLEVDFKNSKYKLNNDEIYRILAILEMDVVNNDDIIEIEKISYNVPFRHESFYDIYFSVTDVHNIDVYNKFEIIEKNDNIIKYKYQKSVAVTFYDEDFQTIKEICDKYYKKKIYHFN